MKSNPIVKVEYIQLLAISLHPSTNGKAWEYACNPGASETTSCRTNGGSATNQCSQNGSLAE